MKPFISLLLTTLLFVPCSTLEELLSARCQASCLSDFEKTSQDKGIMKRQLKHTIIQLCKNDLNCSSCATPCREHYESSSDCFSQHCRRVKSQSDCRKSCARLNQIYDTKPGTCPTIELSSQAEECVTSCSRDGDCALTEKCCSNGCGHSCSAVRHDNLTNLLPLPVQVTVSERKRGRSAVVRWVMSELTPEHTKTFANLFVIQWKWGVRPEEQYMTRWQTITVRNKLYAILKHLLSPGRYYQFRVAAVNIHGSRGFSAPSESFRLSKSPKAPGKPRNLSTGTTKLEKGGLISQEIHWLPPTSDLPIVHYQVTWSEEDQSATMQSDMPEGKAEKEAEELEMFGGFETQLISAETNSVLIENLRPNTKYLVEVHAVVETEEDRLQGEKAAMYLVTSSIDNMTSPTTAFPLVALLLPSNERPITTKAPPSTTTTKQPLLLASAPQLDNLRVEKPYFQNGLLKAAMLWDIRTGSGADGNLRFEVAWWPTVCLGSSYPEFSLTKPLVALAEVTTFELYDLQFGCHYAANVTAFVGGVRAPGSSHVAFETPACQDTPVKGQVVPTCPTMPPNVPSTPQDLACAVSVHPVVQRKSVRAGHNVTAICKWDEPFRSDMPLIGYRVISGQKHVHRLGISDAEPFPSIDRNTVRIRVFSKHERELHLHSLIADTEYIVQIQAISDVGVGPAVYKSFFTPSLRAKLKKKDESSMVYQTLHNPEFIHELVEPNPSSRTQSINGLNKSSSSSRFSASLTTLSIISYLFLKNR